VAGPLVEAAELNPQRGKGLSNEWDFFFASIDDTVVSIFVDLGVRAEVPIEARPWLLWVQLDMQAPRPDGQSSSEETPQLNDIGDALDAAISATCGAQLVARVTGGGKRGFYFHAAEPGPLDETAAQVMGTFDGYGFECGSAFQPEWDHYLGTLYPSDTNLQRMQNRRLLEALASEGDVHELPRKVDHWLYFADEEGRAACRDTLVEIGFAIDEEALAEDAGDKLPFSLVVSRVDSIDKQSINGLTLELVRLAGEHRGDYDGWGCETTAAAGES
jgi:regulator of RNase E activity RraB